MVLALCGGGTTASLLAYPTQKVMSNIFNHYWPDLSSLKLTKKQYEAWCLVTNSAEVAFCGVGLHMLDVGQTRLSADVIVDGAWEFGSLIDVYKKLLTVKSFPGLHKSYGVGSMITQSCSVATKFLSE